MINILREQYKSVTIDKAFQATIALYSIPKTELMKATKTNQAVTFIRNILYFYLINKGFYQKEVATYFKKHKSNIGAIINRFNQTTKEMKWVKEFYYDFENKIDNYISMEGSDALGTSKKAG